MSDPARISIRFNSEDKTLTQISYAETKEQFKPDSIALAINESFTGAGLCMLTKDCPAIDSEFWIKVGHLQVLKAKCIWKKELDTDVSRIGINYLE